jgi:hypothetical protein
MLAGIWQIAEYKGDKRTAFAILTEEPNELVAPGSAATVHNGSLFPMKGAWAAQAMR